MPWCTRTAERAGERGSPLATILQVLLFSGHKQATHRTSIPSKTLSGKNLQDLQAEDTLNTASAAVAQWVNGYGQGHIVISHVPKVALRQTVALASIIRQSNPGWNAQPGKTSPPAGSPPSKINVEIAAGKVTLRNLSTTGDTCALSFDGWVNILQFGCTTPNGAPAGT